MIQRKQSIWFLLAGLWLFCAYLLPFAVKSTAAEQYRIFSTHIQSIAQQQDAVFLRFQWIGIGYLVVAVLALVIIFLFKNRNLQKSMARVAIVLTLVFTGFLGYLCLSLPEGFQHIQPQIGIATPFLTIISLFLGIKGVNDDIKLLKSADRLR